LSRVIANKELKYEDGHLFLLGAPDMLFALNSLVVLQEAMRKQSGRDGLAVFYHLLGYQAGNAANLMKNRFGFPLERAIPAMGDHLAMLGAGLFEFVRADVKNVHFVMRGSSTFAMEYARTFGVQKEGVDWMIKGGMVYLLNQYLGRDDVVCVETSCVAKGNKYCEFVAKPRASFSKKVVAAHVAPALKMDLAKVLQKNVLGMPKRG